MKTPTALRFPSHSRHDETRHTSRVFVEKPDWLRNEVCEKHQRAVESIGVD